MASRLVPACVAAALAAGAAAAAPPVTPWPEVPDPPRSHSEWVARDARVNGLPMRIAHFDSEVSPQEVLAFYQASWARLPAGEPHRKKVGEWDTISTVFGPFEMAVQVRDGATRGSSQGLVSVSNRGEVDRHWRPRDWPKWSDTRLAEVTDTTDGPVRSQVVSMNSSAGYDITVQRWRDAWTTRGFRLVHEAAVPAADGERTWIALFDKPPEQLDVTVTWSDRRQTSFIAANWLTPASE